MAVTTAPPMHGALQIDLFAPGMTALHRVGLAGLAMTLQALASDPRVARMRATSKWSITDREVTLEWSGDAPAFFASLFEASFRLTSDGLIWLPALGDPMNDLEATAALHNALIGTFLQHQAFGKRAAKEDTRRTIEADEEPRIIAFRPLKRYAHQAERLDPTARGALKGWLYPGGVVRHWGYEKQTTLTASPAEEVALRYAPVGALFFQIHRRASGRRPQYCVVLPDVSNLLDYAGARRTYMQLGVRSLHVAGTAEAAVRALSELSAHRVRGSVDAGGCTVIGFGTAAWSKQQKTRVERFRVSGMVPARLRPYQVITEVLSPRRVSRSDVRTGELQQWWSTPQTPDLVAVNTLAGAPWWRGFAHLWEQVRDGVNRRRPGWETRRQWALFDEQEGLSLMVGHRATMPVNGAERRLVGACHDAWRRRLGELSERAQREGLSFRDLVWRERERVRISFARCKNRAMLRQTLTDFWARAGVLPDLQEGWTEVLPLLQQRWQDGRDLALLALASYRPANKTEAEAMSARGEDADEGETT